MTENAGTSDQAGVGRDLPGGATLAFQMLFSPASMWLAKNLRPVHCAQVHSPTVRPQISKLGGLQVSERGAADASISRRGGPSLTPANSGPARLAFCSWLWAVARLMGCCAALRAVIQNQRKFKRRSHFNHVSHPQTPLTAFSPIKPTT